ncbi:hypothetical protein N9L92_00085 [Saprospiraceae bacterium]|nr:hypothetical protein [Saprospiraceae bacterium]
MKASSIWFFIALIVLAVAIYGSGSLSLNDMRTPGGICPKLLGIPACYIVLVCFVLALIAHIISMPISNVIFFISMGIVTLIASYGTAGELIGFAKCPRTDYGVPMCFISLSICLSILLSKGLQLRMNRNLIKS